MMGGFVAKDLGLRRTYQIVAIICAFFAIAYPVVNALFFKKDSKHENTAGDHDSSKFAEIQLEETVFNTGKVEKLEQLEKNKSTDAVYVEKL